ncbi:MAG: hypothetical protein H7222_05605 [Methylotenera sp.]|nr:hypothetical protein [Oligoflexia bacterium]
MSRFLTITLLLAILLTLVGGWLTSLHQTQRLRVDLARKEAQLQNSETKLREAEAKANVLSSLLRREHSQETDAEKNSVNLLSSKLDQEKSALTEFQKRLQKLQEQGSRIPDQSRVRITQEDLDEANRQLKLLDEQERNSRAQDHLAITSSRQDLAITEGQLNESIHQSEERLKSGQTELKERKRKFAEVDQPRLISELEARLKTERSTLDDLKHQKSTLKQSHRLDQLGSQQRTETEKNQIEARKIELRQRAADDRSQLTQLKSSLNSEIRSRENLKQLVHDLQLQRDLQRSRVGDLESQLSQEKRRLQLLSSPAGSASSNR